MKKLLSLIILTALFCIFAATTVDLTSNVRGVLPVANGGNGSASPSLQAGSNTTVTGAWPNQAVSYKGALDTTQWYATTNMFQNNTNTWCYDSGQTNVIGGLLVLTESTGPLTCQSQSATYITGEVLTKSFSFQYGVVKARIRFGQPGNAITSAIWMWGGASGSSGYPPTCVAAIEASSGSNMANCTTNATPSFEIDITEVDSSNTSVFNNYLEWQSNSIVDHVYDTAAVSNVDSQYHIYELRWNSTTLTYLIDGVTTNTITKSVNVPMFLLIDQEMKFLPTSLPNTTSVDWVNVCSDPTAACDMGDSTTIFSDNFN